MCKACSNDWRAGRVGGGGFSDMRRACAEAKRKGPPAALLPCKRPAFSSIPGGTRPGWMNGSGESSSTLVSRRGHPPGDHYGHWVPEIPAGLWWEARSIRGMIPKQLDAELDRQLKRLKGGE